MVFVPLSYLKPIT